MSVIPTISADGVGVVAAGQLNAYVISAYNVGTLRSITGQTGMTAILQGINVPADGGQAVFYWNYACRLVIANILEYFIKNFHCFINLYISQK